MCPYIVRFITAYYRWYQLGVGYTFISATQWIQKCHDQILLGEINSKKKKKLPSTKKRTPSILKTLLHLLISPQYHSLSLRLFEVNNLPPHLDTWLL